MIQIRFSMKHLAALLLPAVLCVSLLGGCAKTQQGLSLAVCVGDAPTSLDPAYAENLGDQTILTHLYENLMSAATRRPGTPGTWSSFRTPPKMTAPWKSF